MFKKLAPIFFKRTDISPLIIFRISFGCLLFIHCFLFMKNGKLFQNFIEPPFTFTYIGFEWLQPLSGNGMYFYFGLMALLAILIMLGAWYRFSMIGFTFLWTGIYLMQKSDYNNHYYLVCLLCFLMCLVPAGRYFSVDAWRKPGYKKYTCPQWVTLVFVMQSAIIYFFAAVSKLNAAWLSGKFIAIQFSRLSHHHIFGAVYDNLYFQKIICYGGILFDFFIIPLLLWKRTRVPAFILFCLFHLFNSYSFRIGIFPYLSIAMAIFFFQPAATRKLFFRKRNPVADMQDKSDKQISTQRLLVFVICLYFILQVFLPMRSWFYPGNVFWNEEGYRMSWKMMLRKKTGTITYKLHDPATGKIWTDNPAKRFKPIHVNWIAICPDIAWQYAQRLKSEYSRAGYPNIQIYAIDSVRLNSDPPKLLINPQADLAKIKWQPFRHSNWIFPYIKPR